jgi:extracellular elastinolytic metalloproteinase
MKCTVRSTPYLFSSHLFLQQRSTFLSTDIGEVWANILHNVYAALVAKYGFDANARMDPTSTAGNAVWLHLFIDALALQPCNPTCEYFNPKILLSILIFCTSVISARDAWIQADTNRYGGVNEVSCI